MPARHRSVLTALLLLATMLPAAAQDVTLPREPQIGPRPFYLVDKMKDGPLKTQLAQCTGPFRKTDFSIGHRGAAMQFPEHSRESYIAAARMGAGIIECDVTFTKDRELVCRHSQCDLHTTTNILSVPALAAKCSQTFVPASAATGRKASAKCCTSDITLAEFRTLAAKMDGFNPDAKTPEEYQNGTPRWRTDLYANSGTLMTHDESIALIKSMGAKFTPELKAPEVPMPFDGDYTQEKYAAQMLDAYKKAGIPPEHVYRPEFQPRRCPVLDKDRAGVRGAGRLPRRALREAGSRPQQTRDLETVDGGTESARRENPGAADLDDAGAERQQGNRAVRIRQGRQSRRPRPDRLVAGARRPAEQGRRLLSPLGQVSDRSRRRHADGAGCAREDRSASAACSRTGRRRRRSMRAAWG